MSYHIPKWQAINCDGTYYIEREMATGQRRLVATITSEEPVRDAAYIVHAPQLLDALDQLALRIQGIAGGHTGARPTPLTPAVQRAVR